MAPDPTGSSYSRRSSGLLLRQVIGPAVAFVPATDGLIRRSPVAPPTGTPRGRAGSAGDRPPVPAVARRTASAPPGDRPTAAPDGWTASGAALQGALPGTLTPAQLSALGAAMTGTTHFASRTGGNVPRPTISRSGAGPDSGMTIRRAFDLPAVSSLFERARAWFGGTDEPGQQQPAEPSGQSPSVEPELVTAAMPAPQTAQLVPRPHPLSGMLRARSSMTEINDQAREQPVADALSPREWDQLVDLVVERIEDRVSDELARRGRRFSPGVF
ncbi:MAG: hypothetical protein ABWZ98_08980 [Nakamurella sp.]